MGSKISLLHASLSNRYWFELTPDRTPLQWFEQVNSIGHSIQTPKEKNKDLELVFLMGIEGNETTVSKPMVAFVSFALRC
ncbi:MAG: hypothetical protein DWC04_02295 [Candidatus Poseidoniales archaeon]|nr:MAG: hypothetical protein DWC04_02295 [Candidatus Poseidoniales archaeon]